jgi:hypothetical protein
MPPESLVEQIAVGLTTKLASIDSAAEGGAKYHYKVEQVLPVDDFHTDYLKNDVETFHMLRPGDEFPGERPSKRFHDKVEFFVLALHNWRPNTTNPWTLQPPIRRTIQNRLVRDVKVALYEEISKAPPLGVAGVFNIEIPEVSRDIFIEEEHPWVPVEMRVLVSYEHRQNAP